MSQNGSNGDAPTRAIVTGGTSGIGLAVARLLSGRGTKVAVLGRNQARLDEAVGGIDNAIGVSADLGDPARATAGVSSAIEQLGGVDLLVNSAADFVPRDLADLDTETWDRTISVNLSGVFHACKVAALAMREAGHGSIVNVASESAFVSSPRMVAYSSTKAGLLGMTRALAVELVPTVRVNALCPGPVDTPMLRGYFASAPDPQAAHDAVVTNTPMQRFATPEEVAEAIIFLGHSATFATGAAWILDGGITMV